MHLIAYSLTDLSNDFASVAHRGQPENDVGNLGAAMSKPPPRMQSPKTMAGPYGHVIDEIRVKTRDFR